MNTTRSLDKCEELGTDHQHGPLQRPKVAWGPLVFTLIFFLAVSALIVSSPQAASAQGTVPPGTIPPGTIPPTAVIYLGFKSSDEIEFGNSTIPDFRYKNEDIVAYTPATQAFSLFFDGSACGLADANLDDFAITDDGTLLFTLRSKFTIPGLGEVDDSDVVSYTAGAGVCGAFGIRLRGADVGLTKGSEDIDALGLAADGSLLISTIGTAKVPSSGGELVIKDRDLIKLDEATGLWSLYFDGDDVGLTHSSEDIRSVWEDPNLDAQNHRQLYLTLSGNFSVSSINQGNGDKNDIEGCTLLQSGEETQCSFFKLLDGETVGIENQLDGLAILGDPTVVGSAVTGLGSGDIAEAAEAAYDAADYAEALAEGDEGVTTDDFIEVVTRIFVPFAQR
ncbi:MAG: hypothetical protein DYG89_51100 [Caldilinea sp. CFX5]|nr:hypothetical protein [Caldilinea sp. CFX5]